MKQGPTCDQGASNIHRRPIIPPIAFFSNIDGNCRPAVRDTYANEQQQQQQQVTGQMGEMRGKRCSIHENNYNNVVTNTHGKQPIHTLHTNMQEMYMQINCIVKSEYSFFFRKGRGGGGGGGGGGAGGKVNH